MERLNSTYLVQRLNLPKPYNNPFGFGGGLINGGLSDDIMELIRPLFSFDYMGAAEFEFGAIPKTLSSIYNNIEAYSTHELEINKIPIYVICKTDSIQAIDERLNDLAKDRIRCKMRPDFSQALGLDKYFKREDCRTIGWLELNNNFIFFVNKDAAIGCANILGLSFV